MYLQDGLIKEKRELKKIKEMADIIIDTSSYNNKDLKKVLLNFSKNKENFIINLFSFGYPVDRILLLLCNSVSRQHQK